ncbi:MAG TPA: HAD-IC family P-type ATPase [Miltoncostaeaceae bacterium]|nr:HAD-IC family P-type ATPase [Miltoncostaeaceae bacterium]
MTFTHPTSPMGRRPPRDDGGLSEAEAARILELRGGEPEARPSRSTRSIVRANTLTLFNLILVVFGVLTLTAGDWRDALFLAILVGNSGIGIIQELRSKRALDRLAALVTPSARVVRDGRERSIPVGRVVPGDLIVAAAGDQIVADGPVVRADGLALDESVLTGESVAVPRDIGDEVRAGSFVAEGAGAYRAEAVGADSYAQRVTGEAREFRHPLSPLQMQVNRLLVVLTAIMVPLGISFAVVLARRDTPFRDAVSEATAGVVTLVPEGLILLVSLAYAISALRMTRRGALAQQLSAVESLSAAEILCLDKTGTLTEDALRVVGLVPAPDVAEDELADLAARYAAAAGDPDAMLTAMRSLREGLAPEEPDARVPFSSRRMWSGLRLGGRGLVLGAPDVVLRTSGAEALITAARAAQAEGRRVLALAETPGLLGEPGPDGPPPGELRPLGLVVLAESLRDGVPEAIAFLQDEGVRPVVISGDDPVTVRAIASDAGIPVGDAPLDGRTLPADAAELAAAVREAGVVGRTPPDEKRRIVEALSRDADVAMMGDGVNDVPALKAARVALCPGSAADMARTVADLVLVRGGFTSVPPMIGEGRNVLRNLQRVAKLFVAKSVLAAFLILTIGLSPTAYPFLPRHLTLISLLTVGIPAFVLALVRSEGPWRSDHFLRDVARFSVPAGVAAGLGVVTAFLVALNVMELGLEAARTTAVTTLIVIGLHLVLLLEGDSGGPSRLRWTLALCGSLLLGYFTVLAIPGWRDFFLLQVPDLPSLIATAIGSTLAVAGLWATDSRFAPPFPALRAWAARVT